MAKGQVRWRRGGGWGEFCARRPRATEKWAQTHAAHLRPGGVPPLLGGRGGGRRAKASHSLWARRALGAGPLCRARLLKERGASGSPSAGSPRASAGLTSSRGLLELKPVHQERCTSPLSHSAFCLGFGGITRNSPRLYELLPALPQACL